MSSLLRFIVNVVAELGRALFFLKDISRYVLTGRIRVGEVVKQMYEQGTDICTIRNTIDKFYEPNKHLGTNTPMPEGCNATSA